MRINTILAHTFGTSGALEAVESAQNIKTNGICLDFSFTPTAEYIAGTAQGKSPYRVLENIVLSVNGRFNNGNGKSALLVDRVDLYQLEEYSDFTGGVDANLTEMEAGKKWRVSGYLDFGYLQIGDNDSLDFQLYCKTTPEVASDVIISSVLTKVQPVNVKGYSSSQPTGSSQTYDDILEAYITSESEFNDTISTTDQMDNEVVNIERCIAYSNAVGRFEKFKRFGQFYEDVYGIGQNLTLSCPQHEGAKILLVKYIYNLGLQVNGDSEFANNRRSLLTKIASKDPNKFQFLKNLGLDMAGVVLAS